jgi:MFS family permease
MEALEGMKQKMGEREGGIRDFLLVLIGQIISLFGNSVMRFALPLHLLNVTGSPALLGLVSGCAFLPIAVMSPVGGIIADRVNKRNVMVVLDFLTAGLVSGFVLLYGRMSLVTIILVMLFLLYGISGAYQPSVQSSIPLLVPENKVMKANAAINMVSSMSALMGPALGGIAYNIWGILPVLYTCIGCFLFSAIMEIFIHIPFERRKRSVSMLRETAADLKLSVRYIVREKKEIGKLTVCCAFVNLAMTALMIIGLPVIVMQTLEFPGGNASQMYGFLQAILAAGGLIGGLGAGLFSEKLKIRSNWKLLLACGILLIPMGVVLLLNSPAYIAYSVLAAAGMGIMALASIYTIQVMSYIQITVPRELVGKVIAWIIAISTCTQPIGQVIYGVLFEEMAGYLWLIFFAGALLSLCIVFYSRKISEQL